MKKLRMIVELEYDDDLIYQEDDDEAKEWFFDFILLGDDLVLVSEEFGDSIGDVKVLKIIEDESQPNLMEA